jgi:hypothetical protein
VGVLGVRGGSDAGAAVVGLGKAGARRRDSSGAQSVEGAGAWYETMRPLTRRRWWGRWGCDGSISRPIRLSPAERVFAEVRRWMEGRRYERIEAKKAAVEEVPRRRGEGLVAGRVALYPSSFECPAFMIKKLCI